MAQTLSYLDLSTIAKVSMVSKSLNLLTQQEDLWKIAIYLDLAFSTKKWAQIFGYESVQNEKIDEDWLSLPVNKVIHAWKNIHKLFPGVNCKESLRLVWLPKTFNGGLTLNSFCRFTEKYFSGISSKIHPYFSSDVISSLGESTIEKSHWVLMSSYTIPGSENESRDEHEKRISALPQEQLMDFQIPGLIEVTVCFFAQAVCSRISESNYWEQPSVHTNSSAFCVGPRRLEQISVKYAPKSGVSLDTMGDFEVGLAIQMKL